MNDTTPKHSRHVDDEISSLDHALFAMRRFYNCTVGRYIIGWHHDRLTIFGISIMLKSTADELYSAEARVNLKAGLTDDEYREVCRALDMVNVLPRPELPNGLFSDRQKAEHGIRLVGNRYYVFTTSYADR